MDFKTATDRLTERVTHEDIAREAGVSVQAIRQARLDPLNRNHRPPPPGWRAVLARMAREQAGALNALADEMERDAGR